MTGPSLLDNALFGLFCGILYLPVAVALCLVKDWISGRLG